MIKGIVDYHRDEDVALMKEDGWVVDKRGGKKLRKTTERWKLLVQWADETESWVRLADMKESHPVDVAKFAKARGIDSEPALSGGSRTRFRKEMPSFLQLGRGSGRQCTSMVLSSPAVLNMLRS